VVADGTLGPVTRRESGGPSPPSQLHRAPAAHSGREGTGGGGQTLCWFRGGGGASVAGRGAVEALSWRMAAVAKMTVRLAGAEAATVLAMAQGLWRQRP